MLISWFRWFAVISCFALLSFPAVHSAHAQSDLSSEIEAAIAPELEAYRTQFLREFEDRRAASRIGLNSEGFVLPRDSLALVALYNATRGSQWNRNVNWLAAPVHTWEGIEVTGDRVSGIDLGLNNLRGPIPQEIGDLTGLEVLHLRINKLTGKIPASIRHLTRLESLALHGNFELTGPIPPEIGDLRQLVFLDLSSTMTVGPIPPEIGNLNQLEWFALSGSIGSPIPPEVGKLEQMKYLQLNQAGLTGSIPPEVGKLSELLVLGLYSNELTGPIPEELGNLSLRFLALFNNQLTGPIPEELWRNTGLTSLDVSLNQLTGAISPLVGNLTKLQRLGLGYNQFSGAVPQSISRLGPIEHVLLMNNQLEDLPDLSGMLRPDYFMVGDNRFTFEDLESNLSLFYSYAPQALVGEPRSEDLQEGDPLELHIPVGGEHNQYQWYRDGSPVPGATSETYFVEHVTADDAGEYTLVVTNDVVTGLTLESHPVTVSVEAPAGVDLVLRGLALKPNGNLVAKIEWVAEQFASDRVDVYLSQAPALPNPLGTPLKRIRNEGRYMVKLRSGENDVYYVQVCAKPRTVCSEVVQLDFSTARLAEEDDEAPAAVELLGSYPNPFNPQTTIRYALPEAMAVHLSVYDVTGRRVAVLVDGVQGAGPHEAVFEASRLPSGTYFGRLEAGSVRQTFRLLLVK